MDRVATLQPFEVRGLPALDWKVAAFLAVLWRLVHLMERLARFLKGFLVLHLREQAPANDFEALLRAHWAPRRLKAGENMLEHLKRLLSSVAYNFHLGFREAGDHHAIACVVCGFGKDVEEGSKGFPAA